MGRQRRKQTIAKRRSGLRPALLVMMGLLVAAIFALLLPQKYVVRGASMEGTLRAGDVLRYTRFSTPKRGDIVVFRSDAEGDMLVIKRVIGMAGDVIEIGSNGSVIRNGQPLKEPYAILDEANSGIPTTVTVEEGKLFLLGDNRAVSVDSRDERIGQVSSEEVFGCVNRIVRAFED